MPLKSVRVPAAFAEPFATGESFVERLSSQVDRKPEQGTVHVGGERYVFMRCESLYAAWFSALSETFGEEAARRFIYNTAREIGRSDSLSFTQRQGVQDPLARLAAGPVHFAHAGWAFVEILPDAMPSPNDDFFLHYNHPNTFESEVLAKRGEVRETCACLFRALIEIILPTGAELRREGKAREGRVAGYATDEQRSTRGAVRCIGGKIISTRALSAGYSSGWCTEAFGLELHGRELRCVAKGDEKCEFILSPSRRLDEHELRVRATWTTSQLGAPPAI